MHAVFHISKDSCHIHFTIHVTCLLQYTTVQKNTVKKVLPYIIFIPNAGLVSQHDKIFNNIHKELNNWCGKRFLSENRNIIENVSYSMHKFDLVDQIWILVLVNIFKSKFTSLDNIFIDHVVEFRHSWIYTARWLKK